MTKYRGRKRSLINILTLIEFSEFRRTAESAPQKRTGSGKGWVRRLIGPQLVQVAVNVIFHFWQSHLQVENATALTASAARSKLS